MTRSDGRQPPTERGDEIIRGASATDNHLRVLAPPDAVARARIVHGTVAGRDAIVGIEADYVFVLVEPFLERRRCGLVQGTAVVSGAAELQCVALVPVPAGELGVERAVHRDRG